LYGSGEPSTQASRGAIFLRNDTPPEEETPEEEQPEEAQSDCSRVENQLKDCEASKGELQKELDECRKSQSDADCVEEKEELLERIEQCKSISNARQRKLDILQSAIKKCPNDQGKYISKGKWTYTVQCNKVASEWKLYKQYTTLDFEQCLTACSKDSGCKYVIFMLNVDANCKFSSVAAGELKYGDGHAVLGIPTKGK
jgi:hypothetical protein